MLQRPKLGCLFLSLALALGCAAPEIALTTSPTGTRMFLNGNYAGTDFVRRDLPYYGSIAVDGFPPTPRPGTPAYLEYRQVLRVDSPASPWLFPLDFLIEIGIWALTTEAPHRAEFPAAQLTTALEVGKSPDHAALRARASAARIER